jgi:hypothetical protein
MAAPTRIDGNRDLPATPPEPPETWTAAGDSTLIPAIGGDMPVTYSTAGDGVAIATYAGDC